MAFKWAGAGHLPDSVVLNSSARSESVTKEGSTTKTLENIGNPVHFIIHLHCSDYRLHENAASIDLLPNSAILLRVTHMIQIPRDDSYLHQQYEQQQCGCAATSNCRKVVLCKQPTCDDRTDDMLRT
jgi:hypothetical protein